MKTKNRTSTRVIRALERALEAAKLRHCGVDKDHQEAMRLYLSTWVAAPISDALEYLKGEKEASRIMDW